MNRDYWIKRWIENRIGFHKPGVNPLLERFWPQIETAKGRVLVPLCGKSDDLSWLAARGYEVAGVELAEIAGKAFAAEHGIEFTAIEQPPFTVLRAEGIAFYVGDFFDLTPAVAGRFDVI